MNYSELVKESISYLENAKKRSMERLDSINRENVRLHLEREIEAFTHLKGFWEQEDKRIEMMKKYSKWDDSL